MLRRTLRALLLNVSNESTDYRAKPGSRNLLLDVATSPYKEQFKEYWATPVPFADREFGEKPKIGEPIPTRRAATAIVVAKNNHISPEKVALGNDNDYKVLMLYRQGKRRYVKDQFIFAGEPITLDDTCEDWTKVLRRRGVITEWADVHARITAMRALFVAMNILLIPPEGGGVAEVEGPPGPRKWHNMCTRFPRALRHLLDVLELPMEGVLKQMKPFRRIITPTTEKFRFDNTIYLVTTEKMGEVEYTLSVKGEKLVWVSPMEAMARFNAGIMNMPTPNLITLSELNNECPLFTDIKQLDSNNMSPRVVQPELYRHTDSRVATVLLPGDVFHSETTEEDKKLCYVRRFVFEKDVPFGVRAVFDERPASEDDLQTHLVKEKPLLLEEANELDEIYAHVPYRKREPEVSSIKYYEEEENETKQQHEYMYYNSDGDDSSNDDSDLELRMQASYNELAREPIYDNSMSTYNNSSDKISEKSKHHSDVNTVGKTLYPVPSFQFQEGTENSDGFISPRLDYMHIKSTDNTNTQTKENYTSSESLLQQEHEEQEVTSSKQDEKYITEASL